MGGCKRKARGLYRFMPEIGWAVHGLTRLYYIHAFITSLCLIPHVNACQDEASASADTILAGHDSLRPRWRLTKRPLIFHSSF